MNATLSQKPSQLVQASPKPIDASKPGSAGKPVVVGKSGAAGKPGSAGMPGGKGKGGGAVDAGPEPPLTKVFQEVEMSSKCSKGVCHVKECFDGKCKTYEKKQPPKFEFQKPDSHWNGKTSPALDKAKKDDKGAVDSIGKPNAPAKGEKAPTMKDPAAVFGDKVK